MNRAGVSSRMMRSLLPMPEKVRGCLLGGAVGDALGAPVEFLSLAEIGRSYGPGGPAVFDAAYGAAGCVTDDTQMTLFTAEGLIRAVVRQREKGICHPPSVVHHAYLRWLHTQGMDSAHPLFRPVDFDGWLIGEERLFARRAPGRTCITALEGAAFGTVERRLNSSKGCGGVMRAAPVGLLAAPERAFRLADVVDALAADLCAVTEGEDVPWDRYPEW